MAMSKTYWRRKMAERLAARLDGGMTVANVDEAERLVWRLCRLANDNARNCERDNDPRMQNASFARRQERVEERWIEREKEIAGLFGKYGCRIDWPGCYPSITADEGFTLDIWEMH